MTTQTNPSRPRLVDVDKRVATVICELFMVDRMQVRSKLRRANLDAARQFCWMILHQNGFEFDRIAMIYNRSPQTIQQAVFKAEHPREHDTRRRAWRMAVRFYTANVGLTVKS